MWQDALPVSKSTILEVHTHENLQSSPLKKHGNRIERFEQARRACAPSVLLGGKTTRNERVSDDTQKLQLFIYVEHDYTTRG